MLSRRTKFLCAVGLVAAVGPMCDPYEPADDTSNPFIDIETDSTAPLTLRVEVFDPGATSPCIQLRSFGAPFDVISASATEACVSLGHGSEDGAYDYPVVFSQAGNAPVVLLAQEFTSCTFSAAAADASPPDGGSAGPSTTCQGMPGQLAVWPQAPVIAALDAGSPGDGASDAAADGNALDAAPEAEGGNETDAAANDASTPEDGETSDGSALDAGKDGT